MILTMSSLAGASLFGLAPALRHQVVRGTHLLVGLQVLAQAHRGEKPGAATVTDL